MPQPLLYAQFKDAEYTPQFVGSLYPELKEQQKVLNDTWDAAKEQDSKLKAVALDVYQNSHEKDKEVAKALYDNTITKIDARAKENRYERHLHDTLDDSRMLNVGVAKLAKEKALVDDAVKATLAREDISAKDKEEYVNNVLKPNLKSLKLDPLTGAVTGEHFQAPAVAADYDIVKELNPIITGMHSDGYSTSSGVYKMGVINSKGEVVKAQPGQQELVFKQKSGSGWETVDPTEVKYLINDALKGSDKYQSYNERQIQQKSNLEIKRIQSLGLTKDEENDAIKSYKHEVDKHLYDSQRVPAINALVRKFGYRVDTDTNDYTYNHQLSSVNAAANVAKESISGNALPTEAVTNPNVVDPKDVEPSKNYSAYVTDASGNKITSKADVTGIISKSLSDPDKLEAIKPYISDTYYQLIKATTDLQQRADIIQTVAEKAANDVMSAQNSSWYEFYDKANTENSKGLMKALGYNAVPYTEAEKTQSNTDEKFANTTNGVSGDAVENENNEVINFENYNSPTQEALTQIGNSVDSKHKNITKAQRDNFVKKEWNRVWTENVEALKKVILPGNIRTNNTNEPLRQVLWNNRNNISWIVDDKSEGIKKFGNFTLLQKYLEDKGEHEAGKSFDKGDVNVANTKFVSPLGDSGDITMSLVTSKGKTITVYTKGDNDFVQSTSGINEIYRNSFLHGRDKFKNPENSGTVELYIKDGAREKTPIEYFTETAINPNFNIKTPGSLPFKTVVYLRPVGTNTKFEHISLEELTAYQSSVIMNKLSNKVINQNPATTKDVKQLVPFEEPQYEEPETDE